MTSLCMYATVKLPKVHKFKYPLRFSTTVKDSVFERDCSMLPSAKSLSFYFSLACFFLACLSSSTVLFPAHLCKPLYHSYKCSPMFKFHF